MGMKYKRPVYLFLIVVLVALVTYGIFYTRKHVETKTSFSDFQLQNPPERDVAFSARLAEAIDKAAADWHSDAALVAVDIVFNGTKISDMNPPVAFFVSEEDQYQHDYTIEFKSDFSALGLAEETEKSQSYKETLYTEFFPEDFKLGYAQILELADGLGGENFRSQHPLSQILLELSKNPQYGVEWSVFYTDIKDGKKGATYNLIFDASTGRLKKSNS